MQKSLVLPIRNAAVAGTPCSVGKVALPAGRLLRMVFWLLAAAVISCSSGCQCCCCGTNVWSRIIDCGVDHAVPFDCVYCAKLDATRINRPGGIQCGHCCRCGSCPQCIQGVYAHRWNSPPPPEEPTGTYGLQDSPVLPDEVSPQGPYFPPGGVHPRDMPQDEAVPLFDSPSQPAPRPSEPSPPPAETEPDAGVVRTGYQHVSEAPVGVRYDRPQTLIPVEALFGN